MNNLFFPFLTAIYQGYVCLALLGRLILCSCVPTDVLDTGRPKWSCTWVGLTQIWVVPLAGGLQL